LFSQFASPMIALATNVALLSTGGWANMQDQRDEQSPAGGGRDTNSANRRWLAAFLLKTPMRLETDEAELTGKYAGVEVIIRNVKRGQGEPYRLDLKFIFNASDMQSAHLHAETIAAELSHTLSFVSAVGVRVERPVFLIDWEPGVEQRDQLVYGQHAIVDPID